MNTIKTMLGSDNSFGFEAEELWKEYASDSTPEANFVKDLDKLELIIQAIEYENSKSANNYNNNNIILHTTCSYFIGEGICFEKWILSCKDKIRHPELQTILKQVLSERPQR